MVLALSSHDERGIQYCLGTGSILSEMRSEYAAWSGDSWKKVGSETPLDGDCLSTKRRQNFIMRVSCHRYDYFQWIDAIIPSVRDSIIGMCK